MLASLHSDNQNRGFAIDSYIQNFGTFTQFCFFTNISRALLLTTNRISVFLEVYQDVLENMHAKKG